MSVKAPNYILCDSVVRWRFVFFCNCVDTSEIRCGTISVNLFFLFLADWAASCTFQKTHLLLSLIGLARLTPHTLGAVAGRHWLAGLWLQGGFLNVTRGKHAISDSLLVGSVSQASMVSNGMCLMIGGGLCVFPQNRSVS